MAEWGPVKEGQLEKVTFELRSKHRFNHANIAGNCGVAEIEEKTGRAKLARSRNRENANCLKSKSGKRTLEMEPQARTFGTWILF